MTCVYLLYILHYLLRLLDILKSIDVDLLLLDVVNKVGLDVVLDEAVEC